MSSLAGIWQSMDGVTLRITGRDPGLAFSSEALGMMVSQGAINRRPDGTYDMIGQGIGGPVRMHAWLVDDDTLHAQNQVLVNGGFVDEIFRNFVPQAAALQPVVAFYRAQPARISLSPPLPPADRASPRKSLFPAKPEPKRATKSPSKPVAGRPEEDPMVELRRLVGMDEVKRHMEQLDAWAWRQGQLKQRGESAEAPSMHMCFAGGPGTGKTTIARIAGRLLNKYGLLERATVREVGRADLVGEFVGQTAPKTQKQIDESLGGVLFIDEAYALTEPGAGGGRDFGAEALAVLIAGMENRRGDLCVIVAGYPDEMERFIDANAGLASRISRHINFPDFTDQELQQVFEAMAAAQKLTVDPKILRDFQPYVCRAKLTARPRQWGNARSVRNILERGIENQALRLRRLGTNPTLDQLRRLEPTDFAFFAG